MKFENCLEKTLSGNYLKPPSKNLIGRYFSKGLSPDGKSVINTKGTSAPVVRRLVAKGDGATGYGVASTAITDFPFAYACKLKPGGGTGNYTFMDLGNTGSSTTNFSILRGNELVRVVFRQGSTIYANTTGSYLAGTFLAGADATIVIEFESKTVVKIYANSISNVATVSFEGGITELPTPSINRFGILAAVDSSPSSFSPDYMVWACQFARALSTAEKTALLANTPQLLTYAPATDSYYQFERNTYDLVSDRHMTFKGTVDLEATYENANGVYSYNLNNGFDRYTDDATGLITRDVPYIDGVPVVSSITGYTKQSSHPAGQNNMAWGFVKIDLDIMDKSNATYWKDSVRALDSYDSENPKFHLISELTKDFFDTHLEDDFKKIVFVCNNSVKSQNLLIYSENQEGIALQRIEKWIETIGDRGL